MDYNVFMGIARQKASDDPAHDALHVQRVYENALRILKQVQADEEVVLTAVLLHELFNYPKDHPESHKSGDICADMAQSVLEQHGFPREKISRVTSAIRNHSFSKGIVPDTIEEKIVQDADRLDAIGAIGIARCFATSASMKRPFYDSEDPMCENRDPNDKEYGVDHFYTKLLRISDGLHTDAAREIARERTAFMRGFLMQLGEEIHGQR